MNDQRSPQADVKPTIGLVYVAAFAPDEGENLGDLSAGSKDSVLNSALVQYTYHILKAARALADSHR